MARLLKTASILFVLLLWLGLSACAKKEVAQAIRPSPAIDKNDFLSADRFINGDILASITNKVIDYAWQDNDILWYQLQTPSGKRYLQIDPATGVKTAFWR